MRYERGKIIILALLLITIVSSCSPIRRYLSSSTPQLKGYYLANAGTSLTLEYKAFVFTTTDSLGKRTSTRGFWHLADNIPDGRSIIVFDFVTSSSIPSRYYKATFSDSTTLQPLTSTLTPDTTSPLIFKKVL